MQDHDQRLKLLLREFFRQFLMLFLPERAELLDFDPVEWLEQEMFPDPPQGVRRHLDLVAKVPLKEPLKTKEGEVCDETIVIVHLEVESQDSVVELRRKMHAYYSHLRLKHPSEPILPIAVYLRVGLNGLGVDTFTDQFGDFEILRYNYFYIGLPALDAEKYLNDGGALGAALSGLMRLPKTGRVQFKLEALHRVIASEENEYRQFLLAECIQSYLTLDEEEQEEFEQMIVKSEHREIKDKSLTWFDQGDEQGFRRGIEQGFQQGIEKGIEKGRREQAERCVARRFGKSDERVAAWLRDRSDDQLDEAFDVIYSANSIDELLAATPQSSN